MWMRHHGRVIPVAIVISSLTSYEGQHDRTVWRYHRSGFFVHNVFAIWGCILSITFVHFVHHVPAVCAWGFCIWCLALCFLCISNTACLLFQWYNFFHFDNGPIHYALTQCTVYALILEWLHAWFIGMSTMQRIYKRNCYPSSPLACNPIELH